MQEESVPIWICRECTAFQVCVFAGRSGAGAPVVGECEGDYRHDSRKNILEWRLPVIDASNKSGSMEFTITGHTNDFFPVTVNFVSKKSFCDIEVCTNHLLFVSTYDAVNRCMAKHCCWSCCETLNLSPVHIFLLL